ncbi:hypothetical protein CO046_00380 [Candidatus Peregrinibacteria bacterium CG_4_9_14_0_2_um_filter_53_11]|nr:MAG: hypothetical protein CO046_00380 [Candidatus Peregrinibacteria bacterium CG_4_9_14_0_2_um_filter_53_11]
MFHPDKRRYAQHEKFEEVLYRSVDRHHLSLDLRHRVIATLGSGFQGRAFAVELDSPLSEAQREMCQGGRSSSLDEHPGLLAKLDSARHFARKVFFPENRPNVPQVVKNYCEMKRAGLRVFPTMLVDESATSTLTTLGQNDRVVCAGANRGSSRVSELTDDKVFIGGELGPIANFDSLWERMQAHARLATHHSMLVRADAYFFLVERAAEPQVDFVVGDIEGSPMYGVLAYRSNAQEVNRGGITRACHTFLAENVPESALSMYEKAMRYKASDVPWTSSDFPPF